MESSSVPLPKLTLLLITSITKINRKVQAENGVDF